MRYISKGYSRTPHVNESNSDVLPNLRTTTVDRVLQAAK
jgi:hypothetical protein